MTLRRIALTVGVIVVLASLATCAELIRRDLHREEQLALYAVLSKSLASRVNPGALDERWPQLRALLHERMAEEPAGQLAVLAYRAAGTLRMDFPRIVRSEGPFKLAVHYGAPDVTEQLLTGAPYRWKVEILFSWDGSDWQTLDSKTWDENEGPDVEYVDMRRLLPASAYVQGSHTLKLRGTSRLWLPEPGGELAEVYLEGHDLGEHRIFISFTRSTAPGDPQG